MSFHRGLRPKWRNVRQEEDLRTGFQEGKEQSIDNGVYLKSYYEVRQKEQESLCDQI